MDEEDPAVRSQLASTAKRIPGAQGMRLAHIQIVSANGSDAKDPHIPLLLWWAIEAHVDPQPGDLAQKLQWWNCDAEWESPLGRSMIIPRMARRLAAEPSEQNQKYLEKWLESTSAEHKRVVLDGIKE